MDFFSKTGKQLLGRFALIAVALCALLGVAAVAPSTALAANSVTTDPPVHQKSIQPNADGTYDLTLTVKGATEQSETKTKANVIVVLDTSGSMKEKVYTYSYGETDQYVRDKTYGLVDGSYVKLYEDWEYFNRYFYYLDASGSPIRYDGQMYRQNRQDTGKSRLDIAKDALNKLADQLIGESDSTVSLSLETFADRGNNPSAYYSGGQAADFKKVVNSLRADGGTNWYDALNKANAKASKDSSTPTYIIFLSDGEPTYGKTGGDGTYYDDRFFNDAVDEANNRPGNVQALYSVYTGSDAADKMNKFSNQVSGIPAFDGTDPDKLNAALQDIAQSIKKTASYKDVKIVDQLSQYVEGQGENGEVVNVTYKKNGADWADAPKASVSGDKITWDLASEGELADGDVYSMTFTIKPNQAAYDAVVKAGEEKELPSNNADGTKVYYKTVVKETGKPDQVSNELSAGYEEPTIKVGVDTVTVTKAWENTGDAVLPASVTVQLKKNGQNYGDPFQLTAADKWTKTITVPAGVGELTWTVEENPVADYDTTYSEAVVGSGALTVTNTHKTWPVTLEGDTAIKGTKTLTGHDMISAFNFNLAAQQDYGDKVVIAQGADTASVSGAMAGETKGFSFGAVTFTAAGTYKFNVTETGTAPEGYTYDTHTSVVTVDVVEKDGKLVATTSYGDGASCVFNNSYEAKPVTVDGAANFSFMKELEGRSLNAGEFSFKIEATSNNNAPLPEKTTVTNAADGTVAFGDITFTKAGVYTYKVYEDTNSLPGGVSAKTQGAKQVTVTVTDNNKGQLEAKVATPDDKTFKNTYKADSTTIDTLLTTKVIKATQDGVTPPALKGGDFSFTISSTDGPLPEKTTVTNDASGSVAFGAITFTKAGEYHYTVTESGSMPGVTNDKEAKSFTVTVKDNGDGTMTATASEIAGFVNTYTVGSVDYSVTADVDVAKSLEGRALNEGEFTFQLVDGNDVVATATNDANGKVSFKALTYTSEDLGEHTYKVREVEGDLGGVTYDKSEYTVKVTVTDNGDGTLSAKATTDSGEGITFKNAYKTEPIDYSVTADVDVAKSLEGRDLNEGEFTFQLVDEKGTVVDTAANDADGNVSFKAQNYTAAGEYTYKICEVKGDLGGVTYDRSEYAVKVTVTDNGDGTLSAKATTDSGEGITFKNTYEAEPATLSSGVEVTKSLDGRDWTDNDKFTFVITPKDANYPMPSNGATGVATKDSKTVSFNDFTFNEIGTYEYTVTEQGTDGDGVTYDTHEAIVSITVTDNGKGQLVAVPTVSGGTFYNTYKAGTTTVTFGAAKVLSGATLNDGQFLFQLKDADGNAVETAKNDANGNIKFSHEFTAAGEYKFTISEFNDQQANVTYDSTSYDVIVTVTDNGKGQLEATVSGDGAVFKNTYTEPTKEVQKDESKKDATPKTGDSAPVFGLCAAVAAAAGAIGLRRRSRRGSLR